MNKLKFDIVTALQGSSCSTDKLVEVSNICDIYAEQLELYRRLGDYVRLNIEAGFIKDDSTIGIVYRDCINGGLPLKAPFAA